MSRGCLITFEGINGCGKSTMLSAIKNELVNQNIPVSNYFCPGFAFPEARKFIRNPQCKFSTFSYLCITSVDMHELVKNYINRDIDNGKVVLVDRFVHSAIVYQGFVGKYPLVPLEYILNLAIEDKHPDMTLLLDVTLEQSIDRRSELGDEKDKWESGNFEETFEILKRGFNHCKSTYPYITKIAPGTLEEVRYTTTKLVLGFLSRFGVNVSSLEPTV